jgi:hypothetical protein
MPSASSGRVQAGHLVVEAEDDDPRRRGGEHLAEELVLLGEADPLVAQPVDHPVVERDDLVDVGLAHRQEARRERLVVHQAPGVRRQRAVGEGAADEADADGEGEGQRAFDGEQPPGRRLPHQPAADAGHGQVHHHEVGHQPAAEAHTGISYFSKRR